MTNPTTTDDTMVYDRQSAVTETWGACGTTYVMRVTLFFMDGYIEGNVIERRFYNQLSGTEECVSVLDFSEHNLFAIYNWPLSDEMKQVVRREMKPYFETDTPY